MPRKVDVNEIIKMYNEGKSKAEIARTLNITRPTVTYHLKKHLGQTTTKERRKRLINLSGKIPIDAKTTFRNISRKHLQSEMHTLCGLQGKTKGTVTK